VQHHRGAQAGAHVGRASGQEAELRGAGEFEPIFQQAFEFSYPPHGQTRIEARGKA
jgi:hypothetical protein